MSEGKVRVDWPECRARGLCYELLPEVLEPDPWGYPVVTRDLDRRTLEKAKAAVNACPHNALRVTPG